MTLIKVCSDIHAEFGLPNSQVPDKLPNKNVDVLVVPGDLAAGFKKRLKKALKKFCDRFPEVVYVSGNHEFWHSSLEEKHDQVANLASQTSNLHFLENSFVQLGKHRFIGATGWFPKTVISGQVGDNWPDIRYIKGGMDAIFERYLETKEYLETNVKEGDIVVTHHMPSSACGHEKWHNDLCNVFFYGNFDEAIAKHPAFWFFGHTHDFRHLTMDGVELICNPHGYPHETAHLGYQDDLIIDTNL